MNKCTTQQSFALLHFMSSIPEADTFEETLEIIANADKTTWDDLESDDDMPIAWEPFQHYSSIEVAQMIAEMADDLNELFTAKEV